MKRQTVHLRTANQLEDIGILPLKITVHGVQKQATIEAILEIFKQIKKAMELFSFQQTNGVLDVMTTQKTLLEKLLLCIKEKMIWFRSPLVQQVLE